MAAPGTERTNSVQVRELLAALGVAEGRWRELSAPGAPGDHVDVDVALRWLDRLAEAGGACGVRARFLRVRLILNSVG